MAWNGSKATAAKGTVPKKSGAGAEKRHCIFLWCLLGAGIAVAVLVLCLFRADEVPKLPDGGRKPAAIREVAPAKPRQGENRLTDEEREALRHPGCVLSPAGVWQPTNRPWRADATKVHAVHTNWSKSATHRVPYRNAVEQMLLTTFSCPLGVCPPPLLRIPQSDMKRIAEILIDKPSIYEDDSQMQAKNKEIIAAAKKKMMEYIRNGGKPENFLKAYHTQLQKAYEMRSAAVREVNRIVVEEGDTELARDFQDEMNRRFKKEGIRPIHFDIGKPAE